ncbi:glycosyltransferase family 39 protein [Candidatus Nomurabacteria bacterium]|nr:glycosyltransferase family 39 protein [Candidatus Nomurabacteria bacterium]
MIKRVPLEIVLLGILFIGAVFRIWQLTWGMPLTGLISDEHDASMFLLRLFSGVPVWNEFISPYPAGVMVATIPAFLAMSAWIAIQSRGFSPTVLENYLLLHGTSELILAARITAAAASTASIYAIYRIIRLFAEQRYAVVGAAIFATSLIQINVAHWGKPHAPMLAFFLAAAYFGLHARLTNNSRVWLISVAFASAAFGTHVLGIIAFIWPVIALRKKRDIVPGVATAAAISIPLYLINFKGTAAMILGALRMHGETGAFAEAVPADSLVERLTFLWTDWVALEPATALLFLAALCTLYAVRRDHHVRLMAIAAIATYIVWVLVAAMPDTVRWLALPTAVFTLLGVAVMHAIRAPIWIGIGCVVLNMIGSIAWLSNLTDPPALVARNWIETHIPRDERLAAVGIDIELPLSMEAAQWHLSYPELVGRPAGARIQKLAQTELLGTWNYYHYATGTPSMDVVLSASSGDACETLTARTDRHVENPTSVFSLFTPETVHLYACRRSGH